MSYPVPHFSIKLQTLHYENKSIRNYAYLARLKVISLAANSGENYYKTRQFGRVIGQYASVVCNVW